MIRVYLIVLILCFSCRLMAGDSIEFHDDPRFEITLNALNKRIALNTYYQITKQYHRLNYVIDMQEEVLDEPFFENIDLVEHKLKEIHDLGQFGMYVIISIPYAPQFNETPEQIEEYKTKFTWALYDKGYHEASAGKGVIVNIDGTIIPKPAQKKIVTAYTAYIGFGSSLSNETIQNGVQILKDFSYYTGSTASKTQACIKLVDKVYLAFIGSPNLNFNASEYTLVYSIDSEWGDIYNVDIDDPQPEDLLVIPTKYGTVKDYTGILKRSEDQQSLGDLSQRIDGENDLLENPAFRVYMTSDYHLSNSRSAIQLVYDAQSSIQDNEVILGFHFRSSDAGIEVQYEIFIGDNYVYPEQKQKIAETFILPFLRSNDPFGKILQETLFISLEYASLMGKASTSFEKSNVPREWWDNDNYFFYLSPEVAGIIDGSLEIAGGAVSMGELMVDIGGLGVDLVSDRDETIASIRKEAGEVMYIALEGVAAYALLSEAEQDTLIAQVQGEITQEISDYLTLIRSGTREGRYEASKLAFNIISTFVGVAELKILFKTGKWSSAAATKIKAAKNAFQGANRKEAIRGLFRSIFKGKNKLSALSWVDNLSEYLPLGSKNKIIQWINDGLDANKLKLAFDKNSDAAQFFENLNKSKGLQHQRALIEDYLSIPGVRQGKFVSNSIELNGSIGKTVNGNTFSLSNGQIRSFMKGSLVDLDQSIFEIVEDLENGITLVKIKPGIKLYRVFDGYRPFDPIEQVGNALPNGSYWTLKRPDRIEDIIDGSAVKPEWSSYSKMIEISVPENGLIAWYGKTARQRVIGNVDNPYLEGGNIQVVINFNQNNVNVSEIANSITTTPWTK